MKVWITKYALSSGIEEHEHGEEAQFSEKFDIRRPLIVEQKNIYLDHYGFASRRNHATEEDWKPS
jgi:hypothetical protein